MILWFIIAAMTAFAVAMLALPLMLRPRRTAARAEHDVEIYRDQLGEIDRDLERGLLSAEEAEAARAEIGRRMLAATDAGAGADRAPRRRLAAWPGMAAVCIALPALAVLIYLHGGAPDLPGRPAAETRKLRAVAEAEGHETSALVAQLARRMEENPNDPRGWALLARSLAMLERYAEAANAYQRAIALEPDDAGLLSGHGEALTIANRGTVTPKARDSFTAALAIDPREPRARFYLGVADVQAGRRRQALDRWLALEADSPPDAPWGEALRGRIEGLAAALGVDLGERRTRQRAAEEERDAMVRAMVERLALRLEEEPDDVEGWLRLGRSYSVLGEAAKSRDAYAKAAKLRPEDTAVLIRYAGSLLGAAGRAPPEFHEVIGAILRRDPEHREALWLAGLAAQRADQPAEAAAHWRKLLSLLEPGSAEHARLARRIDDLGAAK